jgi:hypothetical protein
MLPLSKQGDVESSVLGVPVLKRALYAFIIVSPSISISITDYSSAPWKRPRSSSQFMALGSGYRT